MADDLLTIADHIADGLDLSDAEVSDLTNAAPFVTRLPVEFSSNGTFHSYSKEVGAPVVGFRPVNGGRDWDHSTDQKVTVELKNLDFTWGVDVAAANAWKRGAADLISREGLRHLRSALYKLEEQYIRGTGADSDGFNGFADITALSSLGDSHVINAGGTTANTGSSCWLITLGPNDVSGVMIEDNPVVIGEEYRQALDDGTGKKFPAIVTEGNSWVGMQVGGVHSIVRIANLTEDADKGLTDDLIFDAMSAFPGMRTPNLILTNRRSLKQLRQSRTATNVTGAPAPIPTEVGGVPILVTEAILETEALLS